MELGSLIKNLNSKIGYCARAMRNLPLKGYLHDVSEFIGPTFRGSLLANRSRFFAGDYFSEVVLVGSKNKPNLFGIGDDDRNVKKWAKMGFSRIRGPVDFSEKRAVENF